MCNLTSHRFVTRLTRRVPLVEHELLTLQEHLSSPPVFNGHRVAQSLVLYVCFFDIFILAIALCFPLDLRILITPYKGE